MRDQSLIHTSDVIVYINIYIRYGMQYPAYRTCSPEATRIDRMSFLVVWGQLEHFSHLFVAPVIAIRLVAH